MSGWLWVVILNGITAAAYSGIVLLIVRGLLRTGQFRNNRLAVATAAIFTTCAAHHLIHAWHLTAGLGTHASHLGTDSGMGPLDAMRESMGGTVDVMVAASTALAGVVYLGMRRFYGPLLRSPAMFDDASEARYRQLAANLPHTSVLVVDRDLRFILVEGAGLLAEGYDPRRMEGQLLQDTVPPEVYARLKPYYAAAIDGEESSFDTVGARTGSIFAVKTRPLRDDTGRIVGAMVLSEDVTAEREARAELEQARAFRDAVLTASPDVTMVTDVETGTVKWASRNVRSLLTGPDQDASSGDTAAPEDGLDSVASEDIGVVRAADREAASLPEGESVSIRYRVRAADGSHRRCRGGAVLRFGRVQTNQRHRRPCGRRRRAGRGRSPLALGAARRGLDRPRRRRRVRSRRRRVAGGERNRQACGRRACRPGSRTNQDGTRTAHRVRRP
ncbi:PAS domain S-box-containing protein [Rhodococcus fascians]|nr:PAS domain S-box-containing protein [Rhodococcus fascians]